MAIPADWHWRAGESLEAPNTEPRPNVWWPFLGKFKSWADEKCTTMEERAASPMIRIPMIRIMNLSGVKLEGQSLARCSFCKITDRFEWHIWPSSPLAVEAKLLRSAGPAPCTSPNELNRASGYIEHCRYLGASLGCSREACHLHQLAAPPRPPQHLHGTARSMQRTAPLPHCVETNHALLPTDADVNIQRRHV